MTRISTIAMQTISTTPKPKRRMCLEANGSGAPPAAE